MLPPLLLPLVPKDLFFHFTHTLEESVYAEVQQHQKLMASFAEYPVRRRAWHTGQCPAEHAATPLPPSLSLC